MDMTSVDTPSGTSLTRPAELSVIVPTYNEAANVSTLIKALDKALATIAWEVIFVDDNSPDGTASTVAELSQEDGRVRLVHRIGRRGLSSACVEGVLASTAPYVVVMDGDLQHDEALLPQMLSLLHKGEHDIVIGSRYVDGGGTGSWAEDRLKISDQGTRLARLMTGVTVNDPLSGFFMMRRELFIPLAPKLSSLGYKILLDLIASSKGALRVAELPMTFRQRTAGESKLDLMVMWEFLMLLADKRIGHLIPVRLLSFAAVGGTGVLVNLLVVALLFQLIGTSFPVAQTGGFLVSLTSNFLLNNILTYHDRRLRGWGLIVGWLTFALACSFGGAANVGVANWMYEGANPWLLSSIAGIAVGTIWNYFISSIITWRVKNT